MACSFPDGIFPTSWSSNVSDLVKYLSTCDYQNFFPKWRQRRPYSCPFLCLSAHFICLFQAICKAASKVSIYLLVTTWKSRGSNTERVRLLRYVCPTFLNVFPTVEGSASIGCLKQGWQTDGPRGMRPAMSFYAARGKVSRMWMMFAWASAE